MIQKVLHIEGENNMGFFTGLFMYGVGSLLDPTPKYKTPTETIIETRKKNGLPPLSRDEIRRLIDGECLDKEKERLRRKYLI